MKDNINPLKAMIMFLAEVGTLELPDECSDTIHTRVENLYFDISRCTSEDKEMMRIEIEKLIQSPEISSEVTPFLWDLTQYLSEE